MNSWVLAFGVAAILGVLKAVTYAIVIWACSIPSISPVGGRRLERAVMASFLRAALGVFATPFLAQWAAAEGTHGVLFQVVHFALRLIFWVAVVLIVYRKAPFHSPTFRFYFVMCVAIFGLALNYAWDRMLPTGDLQAGKWC